MQRSIVFLILLMIAVACKSKLEGLPDLQPTAVIKSADNSLIKLQLDSITKIAAEGNFIFRGGTDIESNIIRDFSYKDKLFSHCGIVIKTDSGLRVAHMLGGATNPNGNGGILFQRIEKFLSYPENESAGVYDLNLSEKELIKIKRFADSVKKAAIGFDMKFNLFTKEDMYCTEMLIDAVSYAKNNKKLFPPTSYNLKNTKYFFLSNSGENFLFYPIDVFQHNKLLKCKGIFYFPNYRG